MSKPLSTRSGIERRPESKPRFLASRCDEYGLAALWDRDRHELTFWFRRWVTEPNTYWLCGPWVVLR